MDNEQFFRMCWLALKRSKPRLRSFMDAIECELAGAPIIRPTKPVKQDPDSVTAEVGNERTAEFTPV